MRLEYLWVSRGSFMNTSQGEQRHFNRSTYRKATAFSSWTSHGSSSPDSCSTWLVRQPASSSSAANTIVHQATSRIGQIKIDVNINPSQPPTWLATKAEARRESNACVRKNYNHDDFFPRFSRPFRNVDFHGHMSNRIISRVIVLGVYVDEKGVPWTGHLWYIKGPYAYELS